MISIIIPTYNEESSIGKTLVQLNSLSCKCEKEIIVVDGGSSDATVTIASRYARVVSSIKGKANQLNEGVRMSTGEILFFVHADMFVPTGALNAIVNTIDEGYNGGGFANVFDTHNEKIKRLGIIMNLRFFSKKEQADRNIFYGDNGVFVQRNVFLALNGFKKIPIMEDYDFSFRMKKHFKVKQIKEVKLILSSRRHLEAGFLKTRFQWIMIKKLYLLGVSPHLLDRWYSDIR